MFLIYTHTCEKEREKEKTEKSMCKIAVQLTFKECLLVPDAVLDIEHKYTHQQIHVFIFTYHCLKILQRKFPKEKNLKAYRIFFPKGFSLISQFTSCE